MEIINKRDTTIDVLKFIAIYMVILGHCLGRFGLGMSVLDHPIGKLIVMVNMPLFIFVTGYFSSSMYKRAFKEVAIGKYKTLIRPNIVYSIFCLVIVTLITGDFSKTAGQWLFVTVDYIISTYWFIWVVLYASIYSWLFMKIGGGKNDVLILLISLGTVFILPNTHIPHMLYFKAMYPFFILGYIVRKYKLFDQLKERERSLLVLLIPLYILSSVLYKGSDSFYYFGLTPFPRVIGNYLVMIFVGIMGITILYVLSSIVVRRFANKSPIIYISKMGQYTLAIYMLQGIITEVLDCFQNELKIDDSYLETTVALGASICIILCICVVVNWIKRNHFLSTYFLGK